MARVLAFSFHEDSIMPGLFVSEKMLYAAPFAEDVQHAEHGLP